MLYLQYDQSGHMDGGGAQINRKLAIYSLAVKHNLTYIEKPLIGVITPSFSPEVDTRNEILDAWNLLTSFLPTPSPPPTFVREFFDPNLNDDFFRLAIQFSKSEFPISATCKHLFYQHIKPSYWRLRDGNFSRSRSHIMRLLEKMLFFRAIKKNLNCVLTITEPFAQIKSGNDYVHISRNIQNLLKSSEAIEIGVHVRRGDIDIFDKSRYLPDYYYAGVLEHLIKILDKNKVPFNVVYYVDFPKGDKFSSFENEIFSWGFTSVVENYRVNIEDDAQALDSLSSSDVIIGSRSSYSFVAGLLSKAIVIHPKWWFDNPDDWITIGLDEFNGPILEKWGEEI